MVNPKGGAKLEQRLLEAARRLSRGCSSLTFSAPVTHVYNPLNYAWAPYKRYVEKYAGGKKRVLFVGLNPGPWGMAQSGIPFGDVSLVREWLRIDGQVTAPASVHPKRPVLGWGCVRGEISGRRLWGLIRDRFAEPAAFFKEHFVANYCPLMFLGETGANRTPDKLKTAERRRLIEVCDIHLREVVALLDPEWVIGVGKFAEGRLRMVLPGGIRVGGILHPSPANPAANRDWAGSAVSQLTELGVW